MSRLIEKEGQFYKECGVVMLETNLESSIWLSKGNTLGRINSKCHPLLGVNQNLYITSDDEIKDGDWYLEPNVDIKPTQCKKSSELTKDDRKIIATNDKSIQSLKFKGSKIEGFSNVLTGVKAQPSDKFIQAFINAYNKGKKIEKVLVEYEGIEWLDRPLEYFIKLKDNNNIIIKEVKTEYNREEVLKIVNQYRKMALGIDGGLTVHKMNEWTRENI